MRANSIVAALVVAVALTGCSATGYSAYSRSKACGVATGLISDVVGTDEFHTETRGDSLPPTTSSFACDVNLVDQDDVLTVTVDRISAGQFPADAQQIAEADDRFDVAGAAAGIDVSEGAFTGRWMCAEQSPDGTLKVYVTAGREASAAQRRALVSAIAERVGPACSG